MKFFAMGLAAVIGTASLIRIVFFIASALDNFSSETQLAALTALALTLVGAGLVLTAVSTDASSVAEKFARPIKLDDKKKPRHAAPSKSPRGKESPISRL